MNTNELLAVARDRVDELPGADLEHPFGPDWDVFKVRGRVFMLITEVAGDSMLIVKSDPDDATALREQFDEITPGYHMNKKYWISVRPGTGLSRALIDELVTESYRLVVAKLPKAQRPVDPAVFGLID